MDILEFINTNINKYNKWLQTTFTQQYPIVCDTSSDILASFLKVNYPNNDIKFIEGLYNIDYHCWMEIDGNILDFTIVQFIGDYDVNKPFIDKMYYNSYVKIREVEPSFTQFNDINNFDMYLSQLN